MRRGECMAGAPPGDDLPGERVLADYRGGMLRLTDRRVVYRGRGVSGRLRASLSLQSVTAAGIGRRVGGGLGRLGIPLGLVLFGFFMAFVFEHPWPFMLGLLGGVASLPILWFGSRTVIQIAAGGYVLQVPVSRAHDLQARAFLAQLDEVRFAAGRPASGMDAESAPSTQPYGAGGSGFTSDLAGSPGQG
jgi:hypothetical protein